MLDENAEEYAARLQEAIKIADTLERLEYLEEKAMTSYKMPNRRTNDGRGIRDECGEMVSARWKELVNLGATPF